MGDQHPPWGAPGGPVGHATSFCMALGYFLFIFFFSSIFFYMLQYEFKVSVGLTHREDGKGYIYLFLCMNAFKKLCISQPLVPYDKKLSFITSIHRCIRSFVFRPQSKIGRFNVCLLFWPYKKMHHFLLCLSFPVSSPLTCSIREPWNIHQEFSKCKNWIISNFNEKLCLWTGGKSCIYLAGIHSIDNQRKGNRRKLSGI